MDKASIIGIFLGLSAILGGNILEGGKVDSVFQVTAAVIVFGGTIGATLVSHPLKDIINAICSLRDIFSNREPDCEIVINDILRFSKIVRKNGLIAIENEVPTIKDPFLKRAMSLAVETMNPKSVEETLEQEIITYEQQKKRAAKVFETAGGFAPTIGIIGAVIGLIKVMENLSDPARLGPGIAVAFVATVYGVGSANLLLLPMSKKLINKLNSELRFREMIVEGVMGILSGTNPYHLEERVKVFIKGFGNKEAIR